SFGVPISPRPTLSPSTTLVRARPVAADQADRVHEEVERKCDHCCRHEHAAENHVEQRLAAAERILRDGITAGRGQNRRDERAAPDRKSTRLNSSHVKISYAVFC